MKKTYYVAPDSHGWIARTWKTPDQVFDEIFSSALITPSGFLGIVSDRELHFKGVNIRITDYHHPSGYRINIEIYNKEIIRPEFFELWMQLVDNGILLGEPSERISLIEKPPPPYKYNMEKVKELSMQGDVSVALMAQRLGMSESTVKRYRKELGIQRKTKRNEK